MKQLFLLITFTIMGMQLVSGCGKEDLKPAPNACGNGMVDPGESCDGDCPSACDDLDPCTTDAMAGDADHCDTVCRFEPITQCVSGDSCCPTSCNASLDNDCQPVCGNGVVEPGEECDGNCPGECVQTDPCMPVKREGDPGQCNVICAVSPISQCIIDDGCCPAGCDIYSDNDCYICKAQSLPPDLRVQLPADEGAHEELIEWWYWTGHLKARDGRLFGFQLTFFLSGTGIVWAQIAHHAISDMSDGSFHFRHAIGTGRPDTMAGGYHFDVSSLMATGGADGDVLHAEVDNYMMDLYLVPLKSTVFQHGVGYTEYSFGGYTYYFSRERLQVRGTLHNGTEALAVEGTSWFDHQWGSLAQATSMGWDWFALQLDDNQEYMIFLVHDQSGMLLVGGSYTDAKCNTVEVDSTELEVTSLGEWTSADTGCTYPAGWNVKIQNKNFVVMPMLDDQELHGLPPFINYWEGACTVSGDATGRAYVELTGYCPI